MGFRSRWSGIIHYLRHSENIVNWRISLSRCPLCGPSLFLALAKDPFLTRCLRCRANVTNLAIAEAIRRNISHLEAKDGYEMSHYGSTYEFLKRRCRTLECSEFFPSHPLGATVNGVRNEDAQQLTFADRSFDILTSNQVFEHVPDNARCFHECHRVLRPGGSMFFAVPMHDSARTEQVARLENGEIKWLSTPEFHSSRTTGPNSVPVFWRFSVNDILDYVQRTGFAKASLVQITLSPAQGNPQLVVRADKA